MRWILSILAVLGLAGAVPLATPAEAFACSCVYEPNGPQIVEQASHAASVFTGTAVAERVGGQTAFYEFEVREVFAGDVGPTTTVSSSVQGPACGRRFTVGTEYLVFTSTYETHGAPWSDNSCSATTESTNERTRAAAITVYGEPRALGEAAAAPPASSTPGLTVESGMPRLWVAGGVVVVVLVVLGFVRWTRSRRR